MTAPAASKSFSIRTIRTFFLPRCGRAIARPGLSNSGGAKDGLYRSNDDGTTWKRVEGNGMPEGPLGRIGVAVSGADSNVVYALIEAKKGGLYRSDDGGVNWALVNDDHRFRQRAWYFTHVWADPKNVGGVYIANTGLFRFHRMAASPSNVLTAPHGDHHALWIDPNNPNRMINGNDGGATISVDGGKNWTTQYNQPTAQFYHVAADNDFQYRVYGSQQDNSSVGIRTRSDHGYHRSRRLGCRGRRRKRLHRARSARFEYRLRR